MNVTTLYRLRTAIASSFIGFGLFASNSLAELVNVTVRIDNLAPTNGVSFAPLRLGFGNGSFDSFNIGQTARAGIVSVAEGGSGADWFPEFAAADPNSVRGSIGGALTPGTTRSNTFTVDSSVNPFFTFATMVIPSNDLFLGNDSPTAFRLLGNSGNLLINTINQTGASIWDANSEIANPLNAAFVVGGNNDARTAENGTVAFDFSELAAFDGVNTAGGYVYDHSLLSASSPIYRISFEVSSIPEPTSLVLTGIAASTACFRRRKR
jgi:hypothetical protein